MPLPQSFMQELKAKNDITDVVSSYVNLKRRGRNMIGLCPFHNEKTPSFNIYPENGSFFCFGCEAGGDVITFIRKIENLDYMEAVKFLAQRAGLAVPQSNFDDGLSKLRTKIYEINRETAKFYNKTLFEREGEAGLSYFKRRGMSTKSITHFGLGYAPDGRFSLVNHLKSLGYRNDDLISANVAVKTRNGNAMDRFYSRAMFPIIDLRGNVIAFGGRILTNEKPKYLNTSDTLVFQKSDSLFAMNFAKNFCSEQLILAEGYMDVIALHAAGFENTVATLGTALTVNQARLMARYTKEVVLCYDSDEAGRRATDRAVPILRSSGLIVKIIAVPGNKDPDEFLREHKDDGAIRFKKLIESGLNDIEESMRLLKLKYNIQTQQGRVNYLREAVTVLSGIDNDIELDVYSGKLSEETGVDKHTIMSQAGGLRKKNYAAKEKKQFQTIENGVSFVKDDVNPEKHNFLRAANAEEEIIAFVFANPDKIKFVDSLISLDDFCTDFNRKVYEKISEKSSMIPDAPLSLTDLSDSFSPQELSAVARILAKYSELPINKENIKECINTIKFEKNKIDSKNIENTGEEDIIKYLQKLKENKS